MAYENVKEVECLDISREGCDAWEAAIRRYEDRIGNIFIFSNKFVITLQFVFIKILFLRSCGDTDHGSSA